MQHVCHICFAGYIVTGCLWSWVYLGTDGEFTAEPSDVQEQWTQSEGSTYLACTAVDRAGDGSTYL